MPPMLSMGDADDAVIFSLLLMFSVT